MTYSGAPVEKFENRWLRFYMSYFLLVFSSWPFPVYVRRSSYLILYTQLPVLELSICDVKRHVSELFRGSCLFNIS
jgi:hypothetical protein